MCQTPHPKRKAVVPAALPVVAVVLALPACNCGPAGDVPGTSADGTSADRAGFARSSKEH